MIKNSFKLEINKKNIIKNYSFYRKRKKKLLVAPTIKANAYGLGYDEIFKLFKRNGCRHFFVATLEEGLKIQNRDKTVKIYVLNGIQKNKISLFNKNKLIPIINTVEDLELIISTNINFGVHIDTGINRLGIDYKNVPKDIFDNKNICLVMSHLASADEIKNKYNQIQKDRFINIIKKFKSKKIIFSLANSSGSVLSKSFLFDMIRPGIGLYGGNNSNKLLSKKIKPVIKLSGKIIQIKTITKNQYIGYNQTFITNKKTKIAIIGIGYADGIPRSLSNKGIVYYKNNKFQIIGRISMDSFTIDITKSKNNLKVGMFVDLINHTYGIEHFAKQCKTISNEVITNIGIRVKKIYA